MRARELLTHVQAIGPGVMTEELRSHVGSQEVNFGLRCDLLRRPAVKPASIPLTLKPCGAEFHGFDAELAATTGRDHGRVLRRKRLHEAGVRTLHAAFSPEGDPVFVQWLITPSDQTALSANASEYWPPLKDGEVMVEFA